MIRRHKPLADRAKNKELGTGCMRLFFLPFFLAGAGMFYGLAVRPSLQVLDSYRWVQTPCVVESGRVESHPGESTTYSIEIVYHYYYDQRAYTAKRYNFSTGSSSGRKRKQAIVDRYPAGTETVCFVNPKAPAEAVIDRSWPWEIAIFGAFSSVFLLVGTGGLLFAGRLTNSKARNASPFASTPKTNLPSDGPQVLKPTHTPVAKFAGLLVFALIWNGFIGMFFYLVFLADDRNVPLFAKIIVGLFMLIGVAIIFGVFRSFLALFNPRIRLTAPATVVPLGGELHFSWTVTGRSGALKKLRIIFEGREEATYRRGTNTSTDTKVFAEIPVFETSEREFLSQGNARVAVPPTLMHTFEASNNKVLWRLRVIGEIPRWPDVEDEYPITVLPLPANR